MPGHQLHAPLSFCSRASFSVADAMRAFIVLSSKKSASLRLMSSSLSASAIHGVSLSSRSLSSALRARLLSMVSPPCLASSFHAQKVCLILGFDPAMCLPTTLAYTAVARSMALLSLGAAIAGSVCIAIHAGLSVYSTVIFALVSFPSHRSASFMVVMPGAVCVNEVVTVTLSLSGNTGR